eukprot:SAG31_NODE_4284_length_3381_cov_1.864717_2_plen_377_part_00
MDGVPLPSPDSTTERSDSCREIDTGEDDENHDDDTDLDHPAVSPRTSLVPPPGLTPKERKKWIKRQSKNLDRGVGTISDSKADEEIPDHGVDVGANSSAEGADDFENQEALSNLTSKQKKRLKRERAQALRAAQAAAEDEPSLCTVPLPPSASENDQGVGGAADDEIEEEVGESRESLTSKKRKNQQLKTQNSAALRAAELASEVQEQSDPAMEAGFDSDSDDMSESQQIQPPAGLSSKERKKWLKRQSRGAFARENGAAVAAVPAGAEEVEPAPEDQDEEISIIGSSEPSQPMRKRDKRKAAKAARAAAAAATATEPQLESQGGHVCAICGEIFDSRTQLFKHIEATGHAAPLYELRGGAGGRDKGGGRKGKKKR